MVQAETRLAELANRCLQPGGDHSELDLAGFLHARR